MVERIVHEGKLLALVISRDYEPEETTFVTEGTSFQQVGFIHVPASRPVPPHVHKPVERRVLGTPEVVIVRRGICRLDIYDGTRLPVASRILHEGDMVALIAGGHGFTAVGGTSAKLVEIKQGPYLETDDKAAL